MNGQGEAHEACTPFLVFRFLFLLITFHRLLIIVIYMSVKILIIQPKAWSMLPGEFGFPTSQMALCQRLCSIPQESHVTLF